MHTIANAHYILSIIIRHIKKYTLDEIVREIIAATHSPYSLRMIAPMPRRATATRI